MLGITKRQREVLNFIAEFTDKNAYSPSYEEIGSALNMSSLATVAVHIKNLRQRGYIDKAPNIARSLTVIQR